MTAFDVTFNDPVIREAALPALQEASAIAVKTPQARGVVICQLQYELGYDGALRLTGRFIEHEYAVRINAILKESKAVANRE